jgi:uncharacterized protein (UPF0335 family)
MSKFGERAEAAQEQSAKRANNELAQYVERIETLLAEKQEIADSVKEVFLEAKGRGFDVKVLRAVIKRRKEDPQAVNAFESIFETYLQALGML